MISKPILHPLLGIQATKLIWNHIVRLSDISSYFIDLFCLHVETGIEEVAMLRSRLQSLYQEVVDAGNADRISLEHIRDALESCCGRCQSAFENLGEEKRKHSQQIEQLEQKLAELNSNLAQLKNHDLGMSSSYHVISFSYPVHCMQYNLRQLNN